MIFWKGGSRSANGVRTGLGKDFVGLVAYLTRGRRDATNPDRVAWISCRHLDGEDDPGRVAQIMRAHAGEHFRTKKPVYHFGLSLHGSEHLSAEQWNEAIDQVLQRLGLLGHQALVVAHRDTANEHVHVVVNRVREDGPAWRESNDLLKAYEAVRRIEIDHGLSRDCDRDLPTPELTSGTYRQALHTGRQPLADRVRDQAAAAFAEATGWSDLEARLASRGFRLEAAARSAGLLVTDGSRFASLSRVERSLSGPQLARRFGETFRDHRQAHPEPPTVLAPGQVYAPRPGDGLEQRAVALLDRVTATRATFTESDLRRAAFYQTESVALVREALRSDRVLDLGRDAGGASRYTTREYLDAEARLLSAAAKLASRERFRLDPAALNPAVLDPAPPGPPLTAGRQREPRLAAAAAAARELEAGQRAAVLHATTAADLAQIVGGERAGRAVAARAIAVAYLERGDDVSGAALTANGVAALAAATGVGSRTLATLEHAWAEGAGRLHARSVLLLEEAGLLDVRRLGGILAEAEERGAKVVLLGDTGKLQAIGAGDAYRGLLEQHPSASLDPGGAEAASRQREPLPLAASEQLAGGSVASALDRCEDAGRLRALSRPRHKDLAGDYAAAELRRAVSRLQDLAAKTADATRQERPLREALAAHAELQQARLRVVESRRSLAVPAGQVYTDPAKALRSLLRDPAAPDRLRQGEGRAYGNLRGRAVLGAASRERGQARQAVMSLTGRLYAYRDSLANLQAAKRTLRGAQVQLLASPGLHLGPAPGAASRELPGAAATHTPRARLARPAQIRRELARVTATLLTYRQGSRGAQDAIETAIRGLGRVAVDSALLLLPPKAALPVRLAVSAVERVLDRGLGLGLGR
jgi:AAA domain/Relaxase/Mobilisation nuclease domain